VRGIFMLSVFRSSGGLGGLPRMVIKYTHK
jgi:hypothetical protein